MPLSVQQNGVALLLQHIELGSSGLQQYSLAVHVCPPPGQNVPADGDPVGVTEGVGVRVGVILLVGVRVRVGVILGVLVLVGVNVGVNVGVGDGDGQVNGPANTIYVPPLFPYVQYCPLLVLYPTYPVPTKLVVNELPLYPIHPVTMLAPQDGLK
jgi:hypothetical protein